MGFCIRLPGWDESHFVLDADITYTTTLPTTPFRLQPVIPSAALPRDAIGVHMTLVVPLFRCLNTVSPTICPVFRY